MPESPQYGGFREFQFSGKEVGVVPSFEDSLFESDEEEAFRELFSRLLKKSPKHGLATLLRLIGVQGKEFENKMQLGHDAANKVRKDADGILEKRAQEFQCHRIQSQ